MTCLFIPPYLLQRVAVAAETRHSAASGVVTLEVDDQLRAKRQFLARQTVLSMTSTTSTTSTTPGRRVIHTAEGTEMLPGRIARSEDDAAVGDAAVDEAYESAGAALRLFGEQFGRTSLDGQGGTLSVTVHYGRDYDNAFWDGSQLVFGDGDGEIFDRFTKPMDVMAHEFAHGVTQYTAGLAYRNQSGALNESISDVFAAMTKQHSLGQEAADADWLIGVGLFLPGVRARALRSMSEPGTAYDDPRIGKDPQVGSMADYVQHPRGQRWSSHQLRHPQPGLRPGRRGRGRSELGPGRPGLVRSPGQRGDRTERRLRHLCPGHAERSGTGAA